VTRCSSKAKTAEKDSKQRKRKAKWKGLLSRNKAFASIEVD